MGRKKKPRAPLPEQLPPITIKVRRQTGPLLKGLLAPLGLGVIALLAYANSFHAGFAFDSSSIILKNPSLREFTRGNISQILHHTYWWPTGENPLYRPFTSLSYLFNYAILGNADQPAGYHVINFLLHFCNVLLLFALARRLLNNYWVAFSAAAIWAVHPILTEAVTNIVGRADLLAAAAILGGFLMYLKSAESSGWRRIAWLAGLAAITTMGVFSKENAVTIVGVIILYEITWWKGRERVRGLLLGCAAATLPILVMLYERATILRSVTPHPFNFVENPLIAASFLTGRLTAVKVIAKYVWLLVWPANLSCDYSFNQIPLIHGGLQDWAAWIVVAGIAVAAAIQFRRRREWFFFPAFAFVTFAATSNLFFMTGTIMAERFVYLPSVGFAVCLAMAIHALANRQGMPALAPALVFLIVLGFTIRTWERNADWKNDFTLWSAAVRSAPNSYRTHEFFGSARYNADPAHASLDDNLREDEKSMAILNPVPDRLAVSSPYLDAGIDYLLKGDNLLQKDSQGMIQVPPESVQAYQRALQVLVRGVAINKALVADYRRLELKQGKLDSEIPPEGSPRLYQELSLAYLRNDDMEDAYRAALQARLLGSSVPETSLQLSQVLLFSDHKEDAAVALTEGLFLTGDQRFMGQLQRLYGSGLDPNDCAFKQSPAGPLLNNGCQVVHENICKAASDAIQLYIQIRRPDLVDEMKKRAREEFICPVELAR